MLVHPSTFSFICLFIQSVNIYQNPTMSLASLGLMLDIQGHMGSLDLVSEGGGDRCEANKDIKGVIHTNCETCLGGLAGRLSLNKVVREDSLRQ